MQDYWNDPPEVCEIPECCDLEMIVDERGNCLCSECGAIIDAPPEIEPLESELLYPGLRDVNPF